VFDIDNFYGNIPMSGALEIAEILKAGIENINDMIGLINLRFSEVFMRNIKEHLLNKARFMKELIAEVESQYNNN
jgi:hypothetical protein